VGGAVEAWIRARHRRADQQNGAAPEDDGLGVSGPSLGSNGDRMEVSLLRLRFR
jgi:hypothetical protein